MSQYDEFLRSAKNCLSRGGGDMSHFSVRSLLATMSIAAMGISPAYAISEQGKGFVDAAIKAHFVEMVNKRCRIMPSAKLQSVTKPVFEVTDNEIDTGDNARYFASEFKEIVKLDTILKNARPDKLKSYCRKDGKKVVTGYFDNMSGEGDENDM